MKLLNCQIFTLLKLCLLPYQLELPSQSTTDQGLRQQIFLIVLEAGKCKTNVPSHCASHGRERERENARDLTYWDTFSFSYEALWD